MALKTFFQEVCQKQSLVAATSNICCMDQDSSEDPHTTKSNTSALLIIDQRRPCNQAVIHVALIGVKNLGSTDDMTLFNGEKALSDIQPSSRG